ncbi:hypothetical protein Agabi119p4_1456 [Agaricus bisporus var. burnettii]|uniref:Uncharacterized protein n=1 Tax=Agaricus bisporus var. burnettii TaxID=192524 RepID=A0A8H7KKB9_AGABI|nr:hypothetical protein Agabi119p4_1456 [Agaricus bisporus var. burnettii]
MTWSRANVLSPRPTRLAIPLDDGNYDVTTRHRQRDSISEIDIRGLPAVDDDDTHTSIPPFSAFRPLHKSLADYTNNLTQRACPMLVP